MCNVCLLTKLTVVVHQIINKSLMIHLTVHRVFQCSTWAVNKGFIYITHSPLARVYIMSTQLLLNHPRATLKQ